MWIHDGGVLEFECSTLEDKDRGLLQTMTLDEIRAIKIQDETAIPYGTYRVGLYMSSRFHRLVPILINVPAYDFIEIHPGNDEYDTHGCVLLGKRSAQADWIAESVITYNKFFPRFRAELEQNPMMTITIEKQLRMAT